jgi:hypothetical protein
MNRNEEVKAILRSREIAEEQRKQQRAAAASRQRVQVLEHGYVRNAAFPRKLFG